jgi:hypothetical protein
MGIRTKQKKSLGESASEFAEAILPTIGTAVDSAREKAVPMIQDAREKAAPYLAEGKVLAAEKATEAREKAIPLIAEGRERAAEKAAEGRIAAAAKVNELRGIEPEPKKGGKLKKVLFLGVLAGIGGFVYKKFLGGSGGGDNWQSSYVPAPAPAASTPSAPAASAGATGQAERTQDDAAAASPDEALADASEHPVADTTPDNPAQVVDLDDKRA